MIIHLTLFSAYIALIIIIAFTLLFGYELCIIFVNLILFLQVNPVSAGVQFEKEFVVCSLDLLSGLTEGLGSGIESLVILLFLYIFCRNQFRIC